MNSQSSAVPGSFGSQGIVLAVMSAPRPMYWSLWRELWEYRAIYLAPLIAAAVVLFGFLINTIVLRHRMHGVWTLNPEREPELLAVPYEIAAALIMATGFIVGAFYALDALYGERRDRSILFWKSLPVSDRTTVLAKITIPLVIVPLVCFAIAVVTQWLILLLSSAVLLGSGQHIATLWTQ